MKRKYIFLYIILISLFFNNFLYGEDNTPEPYKENEFPQFLNDLRRFEIISLGALPFVTLDTTLVYSGYRYIQHNYDPAFQPDIFSKSSFSTDEQTGIVLTSLGISVGIGLTDYIVQLIKRSSKKKKEKVRYEDINIYPISEDPEAMLIELPENILENTIEPSNDEVQEIEE